MKVTTEQLKAIVERINDLTGSPKEAYTKQPDGKYVANVGNYHLDMAYGGVALHRMQNKNGGVEVIIGGHRPKKELAELMWAYINGLTFKHEVGAQ